MKPHTARKPFTARQGAAILRLYVQQWLPTTETAKRLRLPISYVVRFLRARGVLRCQGGPGIPRKLSPAARRKLVSQLATTPNAILARKYGVSRELVRQIRQQLGYPSSRTVRREWALRARAERQERERLARQRARALQQQQRQTEKLLAINQLSERWRSGALVSELAQEYQVKTGTMNVRVGRLRIQFPEKFPYRIACRSPQQTGAVAR